MKKERIFEKGKSYFDYCYVVLGRKNEVMLLEAHTVDMLKYKIKLISDRKKWAMAPIQSVKLDLGIFTQHLFWREKYKRKYLTTKEEHKKKFFSIIMKIMGWKK